MESKKVKEVLKSFGKVDEERRLIKSELCRCDEQRRRQLFQRQKKVEKFRDDIQAEIDKLSTSERTVVIARYLWGWSWVKTAAYMHCCQRLAQYSMSEAVRHLSESQGFTAAEKAFKESTDM